MSDAVDAIIEKARELSLLIKKHEKALRYNDSRERMKTDRRAQEVLAELVLYGKELNERITRHEQVEADTSIEQQMLIKEIEANPLIKEHIQNQKEYLTLLQVVIDRIKNPVP